MDTRSRTVSTDHPTLSQHPAAHSSGNAFRALDYTQEAAIVCCKGRPSRAAMSGDGFHMLA
jgi:hypothetical protein